MAESQQAQSKGACTTVTLQENERKAAQQSPTVVLKLHKPETNRQVKWEEGTVDNEHMNKKKSKCCCIYEKQRLFGESSSDEDDDDSCSAHCRGHRRNDFCQKHNGHPGGPSNDHGSAHPGGAQSVSP